MADYRAIYVVCEAIVRQLQANYKPELFHNQRLEFKVSSTPDLINRSKNKKAGVSLFLYQVSQNAALRNAPRRSAERGLQPPVLPLDLYFLLTAWARDASTQHEIAGWMMRVMEDHPVLPATLLNSVVPDSFQSEETVEITQLELANDAVLRIWQGSVQSAYHLSLPYVARGIGIETLRSDIE